MLKVKVARSLYSTFTVYSLNVFEGLETVKFHGWKSYCRGSVSTSSSAFLWTVANSSGTDKLIESWKQLGSSNKYVTFYCLWLVEVRTTERDYCTCWRKVKEFSKHKQNNELRSSWTARLRDFVTPFCIKSYQVENKTQRLKKPKAIVHSGKVGFLWVFTMKRYLLAQFIICSKVDARVGTVNVCFKTLQY